MKFHVLTLVLLTTTLPTYGQKKMENSFITWDYFVENFGKEMVSAEDVFNGMVKSGLKRNCLTKMDFTFISDNRENLIKLGGFLKTHYPYSVEEVKAYNDIWENERRDE